MGDIEFLGQLVDSMGDAVEKLEEAKKKNRISEFNKIKMFILKLQRKINSELKENSSDPNSWEGKI